MHMRCLFLMVVLLVFLLVCSEGAEEHHATGEDALVRLAVQSMRSASTTRLEILCVPREVLTRFRLSPQLLEQHYHYRFCIRLFQGSKLQDELVSALAQSGVSEIAAKPEPDLRWACVFYNDRGDRVLTMYFDGSGKTGLINDLPVTSVGLVVEALERRCSPLWR